MVGSSHLGASDGAGLTKLLARRALSYSVDTIPPDAFIVAKQCVLDWFAVTLPGAAEDCARILHEELAPAIAGSCSVIGMTGRFSPHDAALINGTASHALDYDDVNRAMSGHPTVAVFPAALAVAETEGRNGRDTLVAFIAGYEIACVVGRLVAPSHYASGFHATGTVGTVGAAVAAGLLLGLDEDRLEQAIGLAATQSAGLKAMFGSMAKPLHAGKAAANGVLAARLVKRGFTAQDGALEADQGFIAALSREDLRAPEFPRHGSEIANTLFKYHAACYMTHSAIDAVANLVALQCLKADEVEVVSIHVAPGHLSVCNIAEPVSGLETKFSLRHAVAMALWGIETSALESFSDDSSADPRLVATRQRISVHGDMPAGGAVRIVLRTTAGDVHEVAHDTGIVERDLARQGMRLAAKFTSLAAPVIGAAAAGRLQSGVLALEEIAAWDDLLSFTH
jgi:2-methylcitrate dehydratase PrpD